MEEIAAALRQFHQSLRLEGFDDREAFALTTTYLVSMLQVHAEPPKSPGLA